MNDMVDSTERLIVLLRSKAHQYVKDNYQNPTSKDFLHAENLVMIGALVNEQTQLEEIIND